MVPRKGRPRIIARRLAADHRPGYRPEAMAINQQSIDINERRRKAWVDGSREWSPQAARLGGRKDAGRHLRSSSASCPCVLRAPRTAGSGFGRLHLASLSTNGEADFQSVEGSLLYWDWRRAAGWRR